MKLNSEQLKQHLTQPLQTVYLITGEEPLLVQEVGDQLRSAAKEQQYLERELFHVDASFKWDDIIAAGNELSLFAEKKIIEIRMTNKINAAGQKALIEAAENPNPDNVILIFAGKIESASMKTKWFKTLEAASVHIQIWPLESNRFPQWIQGRVKQHGLSISNDALSVLVDKVDGNLLAAQQEVQKLALLVPEATKEIDEDLVLQSVSDSSRYDVFDLSAACLQGNSQKALKVLSNLRGEGLEPPIIIWALSKDLRSLSIISSQLNHGQQAAQVFRKQGIWGKREGPVKNAMKRLSINEIHQLLQLAGEIDSAIKGLRKTDIWSELSALVFGMSAGTKKALLPV